MKKFLTLTALAIFASATLSGCLLRPTPHGLAVKPAPRVINNTVRNSHNHCHNGSCHSPHINHHNHAPKSCVWKYGRKYCR